MQIVRFMSPGQPLTITDPSMVSSRTDVLTRYSEIIKHIDVLKVALPRVFQPGLNLLHQFAADPTANVESSGGVAEDVINFILTGTFVPCEDISITAVTDRNTRVGPAQLSPQQSNFTIPDDTYASQDGLLAGLSMQRAQLPGMTFTGALALPPSLNRANIIGFEISRSFRRVDYTLLSPEQAALMALQSQFDSSGTSWINSAIQYTMGTDTAANVRSTVHISPKDLENTLGGPMLVSFSATIEELNASGTGSETYANNALFGTVLPQQPYPVPALQVAPVLRYNEILTIEAMAQHVVRNTMRYSKAVWASLTNEERAILLDFYTIGVPPGGVEDASQMVPLLNCVQNKVLGFFGNSMILPFIIPQIVADTIKGADQTKIDPVKIQQSLLAYQKATFDPPRSMISLPTQGVLGEAVLGQSPSAEKIDLTRFWNWQDSPSDSAPQISPVTLPTTTSSIAGGLTAPNSLGQLPSLINNVLTAPTPNTSLLQAMGQAAASQQDFSSSLTGQAQLASLMTNAQNVSNAARADALNTTKQLQSQAMATVGNIVGGMMGGNTNAGSSAASAAMGTGSGSSGTSSGTGSGSSGTSANKSGKSSGTSAKGSGSTSQGSTAPPAGSSQSGASNLNSAGSSQANSTPSSDPSDPGY